MVRLRFALCFDIFNQFVMPKTKNDLFYVDVDFPNGDCGVFASEEIEEFQCSTTDITSCRLGMEVTITETDWHGVVVGCGGKLRYCM